MTRARVATGLSGVIAVDKPEGLTSHDVVARVRRATGERRVGHAGTLDPAATGLLVVLLGPATRLAQYLTADDKAYEALVSFGAETDSCDAEGEVVAEAAIPDAITDPAFAHDAVASLVGFHEQVPPGHSAIKVGGRKAYELARKGELVELEPRPIEIAAAELVDVLPGPPLRWRMYLEVSKGTYVRSIARDLGRALGTRAHLAALRRVRSGVLAVERAHALEDVERAAAEGSLYAMLTDPVAALGAPAVEVSAEDVRRVTDGRRLPLPEAPLLEEPYLGVETQGIVAVTHGGRLLAVYRPEGETLVPETVIPGGVPGILAGEVM